MGRYTFAIGGNELAARQQGINVNMYKTLIFMFSGLLIGIAAFIEVCRLSSAQTILGTGLELDAIVAVVLGGAVLTGGDGSILKTIIGVMFIAVLTNGLALFGLTDNYYSLIKGILILAVVLVQVMSKRMQISLQKSQEDLEYKNTLEQEGEKT